MEAIARWQQIVCSRHDAVPFALKRRCTLVQTRAAKCTHLMIPNGAPGDGNIFSYYYSRRLDVGRTTASAATNRAATRTADRCHRGRALPSRKYSAVLCKYSIIRN